MHTGISGGWRRASTSSWMHHCATDTQIGAVGCVHAGAPPFVDNRWTVARSGHRVGQSRRLWPPSHPWSHGHMHKADRGGWPEPDAYADSLRHQLGPQPPICRSNPSRLPGRTLFGCWRPYTQPLARAFGLQWPSARPKQPSLARRGLSAPGAGFRRQVTPLGGSSVGPECTLTSRGHTGAGTIASSTQLGSVLSGRELQGSRGCSTERTTEPRREPTVTEEMLAADQAALIAELPGAGDGRIADNKAATRHDQNPGRLRQHTST